MRAGPSNSGSMTPTCFRSLQIVIHLPAQYVAPLTVPERAKSISRLARLARCSRTDGHLACGGCVGRRRRGQDAVRAACAAPRRPARIDVGGESVAPLLAMLVVFPPGLFRHFRGR